MGGLGAPFILCPLSDRKELIGMSTDDGKVILTTGKNMAIRYHVSLKYYNFLSVLTNCNVSNGVNCICLFIFVVDVRTEARNKLDFESTLVYIQSC
jgi:hypothetical protein